MSNLFRELKTSSLFQTPFFVCLGALIFALAAWLLRHLCLAPWFWGALCLAGASAGWASVHPLDHYLRHYKKLDLSIAARIAFGSAVSISVSSVLLFFRLLSLPDMGCQRPSVKKPALPPPPPIAIKTAPPVQPIRQPTIPLEKDESYLETVEWQEWHAAIWNTMFLNVSVSDRPVDIPIGTKATFSFDVSSDGRISSTKVQSDDPRYRQYVESRINSLRGSDILRFPAGSIRETVPYESFVYRCDPSDPTCGQPITGKKDTEEIRRAR